MSSRFSVVAVATLLLAWLASVPAQTISEQQQQTLQPNVPPGPSSAPNAKQRTVVGGDGGSTHRKSGLRSRVVVDGRRYHRHKPRRHPPTTCRSMTLQECERTPEQCVTDEVCHGDSSEEAVGCFAVWGNNSGVITMHAKGCWPYDPSTTPACTSSRCVANVDAHNADIHFCCCDGHQRCNENVYAPPVKNTGDGDMLIGKDDGLASYNKATTVDSLLSVLCVFVPICLLAIVVFLTYWLYRCHLGRRRMDAWKQREAATSSLMNHSSSFVKPEQSIRLEKMVSRGRFGAVWKGVLLEGGGVTDVAVKVFPQEDAESWLQEQEIYATAEMRDQPNILQFICTDQRAIVGGAGAGGGAIASAATNEGAVFATPPPPPVVQYWLVTAYQANGCLCDFLKTNTLGWNQSLNIASGILNGLAFLHSEKVRAGDVLKPTVVHRDLKSRNILLDANLRPCIGDFGLAIVCEHGRSIADTHQQVGTHRYMAPEVLELATEFTALAFRQIDVYACALVLWEVLTRTRLTVKDDAVSEYKLPYEDEVGMQPTLAQMHRCVVNEKQRPKIPSKWTVDPKGALLVRALEDMWDTEPDARISAGCAAQRVHTLVHPGTAPLRGAAPPSDAPRLLSNHTEIYPLLTSCEPFAKHTEII